jgi:TetR/AcrR family transcriptional regulator, cholesterol catabolism regulator
MRILSPATARRLLEVATRLFAEHPFGDVRMDDVAAQAGVSKVTLYRYFATKDDLYQSILEETGKDYLTRIRAAEGGVAGCRARLVAVASEGMRYFDANRNLIQLLDRAAIDCGRGEGFPWLEVQREFFRLVKGLFAEGVATGEFLVEDLELAVRGLLGTMRFQHLYPCPQGESDRVPERIIAMLTRPAAAASRRRAG